MRTIEQTGQFKRDYKRETKGPHRQTLASDFIAIITALAHDKKRAGMTISMPPTYGPFKRHRVLCRVKSW